MRAMEQFREIYWEALRAPDDFVTLDRNPYRRETITKKLLGKTKEERMLKKAELDAMLAGNKEKIDKELAEAEIYEKDALKKSASRRSEISEKRQKLGFKDKTAVEDSVIEQLELNQLRQKEQLKDPWDGRAY